MKIVVKITCLQVEYNCYCYNKRNDKLVICQFGDYVTCIELVHNPELVE